MDPQTIQNLMQVFQQGLSILQQAQQQGGGGMMSPDGDGGDEGVPPGPEMPGAGGMPPGDDSGDDADGMGDPGDDGMGGGDSLHDRVSALEGHTGLAKAAGSNPGPLGDRLDSLEDEILGQQFDGPMMLRVAQLEKALGTEPKTESLASTAPEEIPLDSLIKTAVRSALTEAMGEGSGTLPSPQSMRKAAAQGGGHLGGGRRAQQPLIRTDEELVKSAQSWGWDGADLDQPVGLGDVLLAQYHANQLGMEAPFADDDDD